MTGVTVTTAKGNTVDITDLMNEATPIIINAKYVENYASEYYGGIVSYIVADATTQESLEENEITWRIFYSDGNKIYLIASSYVGYYDTYGYCSLNLYQYASTVDEAIEFLLDSENWALLEDNNFADYAQGAPTLEMYVSCWNVRHPENKIYYAYGDTGYLVGDTENPTGTSVSFGILDDDLFYVYLRNNAL